MKVLGAPGGMGPAAPLPLTDSAKGLARAGVEACKG